MNELTFEQILEMLQGGARKFSGGVMGVGETGMRAAGKVNENNFLNSVMGGETTSTAPNLDPVAMRSMVSTNNDSGTDPLMMAGANAVGAGLNDVAQPVMNSIGFPDSRGFDTPANRDNYNLRRIQQLESMLTADEANVYYQLEDFQKDAFLQAIEENKISQYEAENFDRLRMPY
jgi:hypothetical protein